MLSKDEQRQMRSTLTRDNKLGYQKLRWELLHKGHEAVSRAKKERDLQAQAKSSERLKEQAGREMQDAYAFESRARFSVSGAAAMDPQGLLPRFGMWDRMVEAVKGYPWGSILCRLGFHDWLVGHKMVFGKAYGLEKRCRREGCTVATAHKE